MKELLKRTQKWIQKELLKRLLISFLMVNFVLHTNGFINVNEFINAEETGEDEATAEENGFNENEMEISAPSAILMEASTGAVIYEKDADTPRPPASVTKVMTMLLIFDALKEGKITLQDEVITSEHAASMGGSQVFLEVGEKQTVDTLLKCISVASGNDACVCMAEYISGNEEAFVKQMNQRAADLGMEHTHFVNCNGLDADGHETSARDIALMSRELITQYPQIFDYCTIWMENITHNTARGSSEFGLTNTNKLIRQYEYATGLKTGSTGNAKFCVSATAEKNGVNLIAVIMGADDSKKRFKDAVTLLNHGFGVCQIYRDEKMDTFNDISVEGSTIEKIPTEYAEQFTYLDTKGINLASIEKEAELPEVIQAPVEKGAVIGQVVYRYDGNVLGTVDLLAGEDAPKAKFLEYLRKSMTKIAL